MEKGIRAFFLSANGTPIESPQALRSRQEQLRPPLSRPQPALLKTPAPPRDAATVVVLRDGARGLEMYLVKRARTVDFMGGAHVFPGGRLDKADSSPSTCALLSTHAPTLHERLGEALPATHAA